MPIFASKADKQLKKNLKNLLGFSPNNLLLYKLAFRHRSVATEIKDGIKASNERLEFLGDAIIGSIVSEYLFKKFPFKDEGFLTKLRSRIVSRNNFNQLSQKLGINNFIEVSKDSKFTVPSSINGDAFEAFIGAIFMDKGYKKTTQFVVEKIIKMHLDIETIAITDNDFKSKIIEWVQRERKVLKYMVTEDLNAGKQKLYVVKLHIDEVEKSVGKGFSKKQAEQAASELLCAELGID